MQKKTKKKQKSKKTKKTPKKQRMCILVLPNGVFYKWQLDPVTGWCWSIFYILAVFLFVLLQREECTFTLSLKNKPKQNKTKTTLWAEY